VIGGVGDDPSIVGVGHNLLIKMPAPRRTKAWDELWSRYKAERALLDAYTTGELRESVIRFEDNEAHCQRRHAFNLGGPPDERGGQRRRSRIAQRSCCG
jgi:hypothetical protein